jgi:glycosyltransferase involved in cell wall biosynthesis
MTSSCGDNPLVSRLHRHLWQRLPRRPRRSVLLHAAALAAPRPSSKASPALPLIVGGCFRTASGLGESARLCHDALKAAGLPVFGIDLTSVLMQPEDVQFPCTDGRAIIGQGTLILHVNSPLVPLAMLGIGRSCLAGKHVVGYWSWELPRVPADWRHGISFVHQIWVPSTFTAAAVKPVVAGSPVHVVPHPVALRSSPKPQSVNGRFTVLSIFNMASSISRKNPLAAIRAFRRAFGDDPECQLVLKCVNGCSFSKGLQLIKQEVDAASNVVFVDKPMSTCGIAGLYDQADALLSLHRSEGFGLTIAEAMLRGLPVVCTNWSGNVDFLSPEVGVPIRFRLLPAQDPQGTYEHPEMAWAEPDVDEAAAALKILRSDPQRRELLGQRASAAARDMFSPARYLASVTNILRL